MKTGKKLLSTLLALCMVLSLVAIPASAASMGTLEVGTASADPGQSVTLEFKLTNNQGIKSLGAHVYYKADVLTCDSFEVSEDFRWDPVTNPDDSGISQEKSEAGWKMATFGAARAAGVTNDGVLATLTFTVKADAENTTTPIEIEYDTCTDINDVQMAELTIKNGSVTVTNAPATIGTVTLDKNSVEVNGTQGGTVAASAASAKGTNITNNVTWSVAPAGQGVTVAANGAVTVGAKATAGTYTITAAPKTGETQGTAKTAKLTVTRATSVVDKVEIASTPSTTIAKPVSGDPKEVTYVATAYDQYGDAMTTGATITWSNDNALANVTVAAGKVTVPTNAGTGSFKLTATCGGQSASITVNVVDIEFTGADAAITASGTYGQKWSEIVKIDASKLTAKVGDDTVTGTYSVVNAEQYPNSGNQTYTVVFNNETYQNIPVVSDQTVTIAKKPVTVVAEDKTRPYGNANPELTWTVTGLVGADTKDALTVNLTTTATATTAVGEVAITGTGTADNYAVTVTPGKLTITPVKVTEIKGAETALNLSKAEVLAANDLTALGLAEKVTLSFSDNVADAEVTATYDKALADIKSAANSVTDTRDGKVEVALTNACFPAYADKAGSTVTMPKTTITITNKYPIPAADITMADTTVTYGDAYEDPTVTMADKPEYEGVTFTYAYTDKDGKAVSGKPVNAGEYTVTVTVENDSYKGSQTAKLTVEPKPLADNMVTLPADVTYTYNKKPHTPTPTVVDGETTLRANTDYTVAYADNVNAGTATVTVTGKGNYGGTATATFTIDKASLAELKPAILGTAQAGNVLTASLNGVAYEELNWILVYDGEDIELGGNFSVELAPMDSNKTIAVKAVAVEDGNYEGETQVSDTVTVTKFTVAGFVYVTETNVTDGTEGKIEPGDVLTAEPDLNVYMGEDAEPWYTFQWFNDGQAIDGATEAAYTVAQGDKTLTVTVTPNENFNGSVTSAPVEVGKTVLAGTVTLPETAAVGDEITAAITVNGDEGDYDIAWFRNGEAIPGATGATYTVTKADQGKVLAVKLTAKGDYTGELVFGPVEIPAGVPDAPVARAAAGNTTVTVSWNEPATNGAPILYYVVWAFDDVENEDAAPIAYAQVNNTTRQYTFEGLTNDTEYGFIVAAYSYLGGEEDECSVSEMVKATPTAPSYSGGGGSSTTNTKTETLSDGTKVTTTELSGGVIRESITRPNGTTATMTYNKDGSGTGTVNMKDGSKATVTTTKDGETTAVVTVPTRVDTTNVTIPAKNVKPGTVAVIVKDDGTEEIVRMSAVDEVGVMVKLADNATVKLVDNTKNFVDVPGHWAEANVAFVSAHELFNGTDDTHFSPNGTMTRGMMATVLFRLDGENKGDVNASFADVADGTWYTDAVAWANAQGIVTGYSDAAFGPEDNVTREQLAVMIYRYAQALKLVGNTTAGKLDFADADSVNDWASEAMSWLTANGILIGKPGNLLDPQGNATRAEVSAVLERFVEFAVK